MSDDRSARLWPANDGRAPLALEIPGNTFADRGYQRVELFARGGVEPMESQLTNTLGRKEKSAAAWTAVFDARFKPVVEAYSAFDDIAYEAEVFWGESTQMARTELRACASALHSAIGEYVDDKSVRGLNFKGKRGRQRYSGIKPIIWAIPEMKRSKQFSDRITKAVDDIKQLARPKLHNQTALSNPAF